MDENTQTEYNILSNRCVTGYLDPNNKSVNYFIIVQGGVYRSKKIIESLNKINSNIKILKPKKKVNVVAVSKTFPISHISPLIDYGHSHFGENKVQEASAKWKDLKKDNFD